MSIIRISGAYVKKILFEMTRMPNWPHLKCPSLPQPRTATRRLIISPSPLTSNFSPLDQGIVIFFPAPYSYTGEDVAEFHLHGSPSVIKDTLVSLGDLHPNIKFALPGEFTKRAWHHNKFTNLTQLDAIADLIHSETTYQRLHALGNLDGEKGNQYLIWNQSLVTSLAYLEALVDFGDDNLLVLDKIRIPVQKEIEKIIKEIKPHLDDQRGMVMRHGIEICLFGKVNAGKSSLINAISQSNTSIVSSQAGTTRDVVQIKIDLDGYPVILQDTAGLSNEIENDKKVEKIKNDKNQVEKEGIKRAIERYKKAQIQILVIDVNQLLNKDIEDNKEREMKALIQQYLKTTIVVINKIDLLDINQFNPELIINKAHQWINSSDFKKVEIRMNETKEEQLKEEEIWKFGENQTKEDLIGGDQIIDDQILERIPVVIISCITGEGLDQLNKVIRNKVENYFHHNHIEEALVTRQRYRTYLQETVDSLERCLSAQECIEIAVEELRLAKKSIERITGKGDVEEVLEIIFKDFCIGK